MVFLQMPLFDLREPDLKTPKDKWLFFLKNLESFDDVPSILREPVFEQAFSTAEYIKYSPAMQEAYQRDLMAYRDNRNVLETARIEGHAEGRAEGEAIGEAKKARETAVAMKQEGFDPAVIARMTGLPLSEIEKLG
jgi:predicted transposase/invertase (TIGR01784 family)